jgi:phosphatidylinositol alpha-1,6-mannosyltransferase
MSEHRKLLIVTNDFPPRQGGIQSFVFELARRLPPDQVAVYCSTFDGATAFDATLPFPVRRHPTGLLVPTPAARRRVLAAAKEFGSTSVWFGAAAPLALLAPALRSIGATRLVATTHGHEAGWAMLPLARQVLRRIGNSMDVVTYLGEYTRRRLAGALGPDATMVQLTPGVDPSVFAPAVDGKQVRVRYGLADRPVVVCVSRLVPRKGQDTLIEALPDIRRQVPETALLLVGKGPYRHELQALAERTGVGDHVIMTGSITQDELPAYFAAGDVFAMPCRTRRFGLDVEGLGIVFLEASAAGLPVVAGNSGGAPDAVQDGVTGRVVDGTDRAAVANEVARLLGDADLSGAYGKAGRQWVEDAWQWDAIAQRLAELLLL